METRRPAGRHWAEDEWTDEAPERGLPADQGPAEDRPARESTPRAHAAEPPVRRAWSEGDLLDRDALEEGPEHEGLPEPQGPDIAAEVSSDAQLSSRDGTASWARALRDPSFVSSGRRTWRAWLLILGTLVLPG